LDFLTRNASYEGDHLLITVRANPRSFGIEAGTRVDCQIFFTFEANLMVGPFSVCLLYDSI
jgi:hypothetical protein